MMIMSKSEAFDLMTDYQAVFEAIIDINHRDNGKFNWATKHLGEMFGYMLPGSLEGKMVELLVPDSLKKIHAEKHRPEYASNPLPRLMGLATPGTVIVRKLTGQRKDGSVFPIELSLMPKESSGIAVVLGIIIDMTGRSQP